MHIRFARKEDARQLLDIYRQYIDTTITFEYDLPSEKEFQKRIEEYSAIYPYFVCEENERCIAYVYAHRAQERAAYQWNAELSIYIHKSYRKKGLGIVLYQMMFEFLKIQGIKTLYGLVTTPNPPSIKLHEKTGFILAGTYHNTGYKAEKWCDVLLFEKQINTYNNSPTPIIPITEINADFIESMIKKYEMMIQQ